MRGFGLLEVMVAFVIAALALGVLIEAAGDALRASSIAARTSEAVVRARSHLAMALADEAPVPGEQEGDDGGGFRWHVRVTTLSQDAEDQPGAVTLYAATVWITWHEGEVRLESERVGRPAGAS